MDYHSAKKKLEYLVAGMKRDLQKYAQDKDASPGAILKKTQVINTMINFYNAAEEKISVLEGTGFGDPKASTYIRDDAFEKAVLSYFGLDVRQKNQADRISQCCACLHNNGQLDWFKIQFKNYCEFKNITGFKHGFYSFLGTQDQHFANGNWNAENWERKLIEEKSKSKPAVTPMKETAIEKRNKRLQG